MPAVTIATNASILQQPFNINSTSGSICQIPPPTAYLDHYPSKYIASNRLNDYHNVNAQAKSVDIDDGPIHPYRDRHSRQTVP